MKPALCVALLGCLLGLASCRTLLAPSPTEMINAQRQQAAMQAAVARGPSARRLQPPCFVPTSFYPYQTCGLSQNATVCGRGFLAWPTYEQCCAVQKGPIGAFTSGCTDFTKNVTCWVAGTYYPTQTCRQSTDISECTRNWGQWKTEDQCCSAGSAFSDGCTKSQPCYVANNWYPTRSCGRTDDQSVCQRGWGAFNSQDECCAPGAGFSDGCGTVTPASGDATVASN